MDNLFSKSMVEKGKFHVDFMKLASKNFNHQSFSKTTKEPNVVFELLTEESKKSKNISNLHFTNFIGKPTNQNHLARVVDLFSDLSTLSNMELTTVHLFPRVINILNLYHFVESLDQVESNVVKVDLKDILGNQIGVRIYCAFDHEVVDEQWLVFTKVILVDLYHLVIPSEYNGMNPKKAKEHNYKLNKDNKDCLSNYLV